MDKTNNFFFTISPILALKKSKLNYLHTVAFLKLKIKVQTIYLKQITGTFLQFKSYKSYWHHKINSKSAVTESVNKNSHFICLKPNYSAGIGHQLANWNAGLYFAGYFNLKFAHFPFSEKKWEQFLGFAERQVTALSLIKNSQFKKIKLPRFDSNDGQQVELIRNIIDSYTRPRLLFILEHDQGYMRQFETYQTLSQLFFSSAFRKNDKLLFNKDTFNIVIHVRRGDIVDMKNHNNPNWKDRWLDNSYYVKVLETVLANIKPAGSTRILLFSQGNPADFSEFNQFNNIEFMLDTEPIESFLNMVFADILISSKSSFSYKPALISKGIKICPEDFWHAYPKNGDFILADNGGNFDVKILYALMDKMFTNDNLNQYPHDTN